MLAEEYEMFKEAQKQLNQYVNDQVTHFRLVLALLPLHFKS